MQFLVSYSFNFSIGIKITLFKEISEELPAAFFEGE